MFDAKRAGRAVAALALFAVVAAVAGGRSDEAAPGADPVLFHDATTPPPARPVVAAADLRPEMRRSRAKIEFATLEACDRVGRTALGPSATMQWSGFSTDSNPETGEVFAQRRWDVQNAFGATRVVVVSCVADYDTDTWRLVTIDGKALAI